MDKSRTAGHILRLDGVRWLGTFAPTWGAWAPLVLARTLRALETLKTAVELRLLTAQGAGITELRYQAPLENLTSTGFLQGRAQGRRAPRARPTLTGVNGDVHLLVLDQQSRSEEHTSELQSLRHLVCRLLLEKKKTGGTGVQDCAEMVMGMCFGWVWGRG